MFKKIHVHKNKTGIKYGKTLIVVGFWEVFIFFMILIYIPQAYKEPVIL